MTETPARKASLSGISLDDILQESQRLRITPLNGNTCMTQLYFVKILEML